MGRRLICCLLPVLTPQWRQRALFGVCLLMSLAFTLDAIRQPYPGQLANLALLPAAMLTGLAFTLMVIRRRDAAACLLALYLLLLAVLAQGNIAGLSEAPMHPIARFRFSQFLWVLLLGATPLLFAGAYTETDWEGRLTTRQFARLLTRLTTGCAVLVLSLILARKAPPSLNILSHIVSPYHQALLLTAPAPVLLHGFAVWWLLQYYRKCGEMRHRAVVRLIGVTTLFLLSALLSDLTHQPAMTIASNLIGCLIPFLLISAWERHGLFDIRITLRRAVQYALARQMLTVLTVLPLVLLAFLLGVRFQTGGSSPTWIQISTDTLLAGSTLACICLTIAFAMMLALRIPLLKWFDRTYFREVYNAQEVLEEVGRTLLGINEPKEIARTALIGIDQVLHPVNALLIAEDNGSLTCLAQRNYTGYQAPLWPAPDLLEVESLLLLPPSERMASDARLPVMARFTPAARTTLQQAGIRLILPLRLHDRVIGALLLGEKQSGQDYLPEDMEMLLALGAQITLALQNAALTRAFLHRRTHEITAGSRRFVQMMEQERHLLAADLHDQTLPELRCLLTDLEELAAREEEGKLADTATEVHHTARDMAEHLRCTIQDIRDIMESLSPSALEMLGLMPALENELRKSAARARPPLRPQFQAHHPIPPRALTPFVELSLFRILQEGITNACRHAQAATVRLQVSLEENEYVLRLEDDGTGMPAEEARPHGRGLDNMRFRAGLIGAQISWSVPEGGAGTRVEVRLPQEPPAAIERLSGGHREQN